MPWPWRDRGRGIETNRDTRFAYTILGVSLVAGLGLRIWLALRDHSIYWPDEIYQTLEPAHRLAFGYGLIAWEWVEGNRNWTLPGLIALFFNICDWLDAAEPQVYLSVVRLVFAGASAASAGAVYLIARTYGAQRSTAAIGAAVGLLFAPSIYFSHRALSEVACSLPAILGFALAYDPQSSRRRAIAGANLLGLSIVLRLQCGVFALVLLGIFAVRRAYRRALDVTLILAVWAFALGLLDHLTWADAPGARFDGWFHSAWKYVHFNAIEGRASDFGTAPWSYYFTTLFGAAPVLIALSVLLAIIAVRRAPGLWLAAALFLGMHALVAHKELRFVIPMLPFAWALTAVGLDTLPSRFRTGVAAVLVVAAITSAAGFRSLTFHDVGHFDRRPENAYSSSGPVNRLLLAARKQPLLCGLSIEGVPLVWTGGYSYLHRRVPLFGYDVSHIEKTWVNFVIGRVDSDLPGRVIARDGDWVLRDLSVFPCIRPPDNWWRL